jgi:group I intron endonuclease
MSKRQKVESLVRNFDRHICGIYLIRNLVNGRVYVGKSLDVESRLASHRRALKSGEHNIPKLQADWNEFGDEQFEFLPYEEVDLNWLKDRENYLIVLMEGHTHGYNRQFLDRYEKRRANNQMARCSGSRINVTKLQNARVECTPMQSAV